MEASVGRDGFEFTRKRKARLFDDDSSSGGNRESNMQKNKELLKKCGKVAKRYYGDSCGGRTQGEIQKALFGAAIEYWQLYQVRYFEGEDPSPKQRDLGRSDFTDELLIKLMEVGTYSRDPNYVIDASGISHRPPLLATLPVRFTDPIYEEATSGHFIEIVSVNNYFNISNAPSLDYDNLERLAI